MTRVIFWDEDTQHDFMDPDGRLYVPHAEQIVGALEQLTHCAREHGIPIIAVMCDHTETDAEISTQPNYQTTFPPHCMRGTRGQQRIAATAPQHGLYIENRVYTRAELEHLLRGHRGEIVIKKQALDPFSNPATDVIVSLLDPEVVIVYGVAQDFCVNQAVIGLTDRRRRVCVVRDATKPINAYGAMQCEAEWRRRGVEFATTADVVAQRVVRFDRQIG